MRDIDAIHREEWRETSWVESELRECGCREGWGCGRSSQSVAMIYGIVSESEVGDLIGEFLALIIVYDGSQVLDTVLHFQILRAAHAHTHTHTHTHEMRHMIKKIYINIALEIQCIILQQYVESM